MSGVEHLQVNLPGSGKWSQAGCEALGWSLGKLALLMSPRGTLLPLPP